MMMANSQNGTLVNLKDYLASQNNLPALSDEDLGNALIESGDDNSNRGGFPYMKFNGQTGVWASSITKTAPDPEDLFIVNIGSFVEGFVYWEGRDNKMTHEWLVSARAHSSVHEDDLEDLSGPHSQTNDGWKKMMGFEMVTPDGQMYKFRNNSKSGVGMIGSHAKECGIRVSDGDPCYPIIELGSEGFESKDGQKNYKPTFLPQTWVTRAALDLWTSGGIDFDQLFAGQDGTKKPKPPRKPKPGYKRGK